MYYLKPMLAKQKSFYRKAEVDNLFGRIILTSYTTPVCSISQGVIRLNGLYSWTTTRHIKDFLYQHELLFKSNPAYAALIASNYATKELRKLVEPDTYSKAFNYANCK